MNRFNLTFSGEIVTGHSPAKVKLRFGKMFAIDDPVRLERFFSGDPIILRRNLERKEAAQYFQDMRKIGATSELVKVTASDAANAIAKRPTPSPDPVDDSATKREKISTGTVPRRKGKSRSQSNDRAAATRSATSKAEKALEDAARKKSRKEAAQRKAAEDVAHHKARLEAEEQAKVEKVQRLAEEVARLKAEQEEQEEQERLKAEEAARLKAEQQEQKRLEAEEAARLKAEQEEQERLKAAEAARLKAEQEEQERLKTEEAARLKAEQEEQERLKAEEAARLRAEQQEQKRLKAEEAARLRAEQQEQKRLKAEEAARLKAEQEEQKRLKAEEAARLKAEQQEQKRRKAAEAAKLKAEREAQKRRKAEETARLKAEREKQEEQQRREAEEASRLQAELDEIQHQQEVQAAQLQADLAEKERQTAAEAARINAEAEQKKAEAQRKSQERQRASASPRAAHQIQEEHAAPDEAPEQQAVPRAAAELPNQISLKPVKARVKTNLEVPQRLTGQTAATEIRRKRQLGEPNLYQMQAFRNTPEVRNRAALAKQRMRQGFTFGALALASLLLLTGAFLRSPPNPAITGASAIAIDPRNGPVMLAGDRLLFHDRAGIDTGQITLEELGLATLQSPMGFQDSGELIALGQLIGSTEAEAPILLRCNLAQPKCLPLSSELVGTRIGAFAINTIDNSLLLADIAGKQLLKANAQGQVTLRKAVAMPERPSLRLNSGLLFMNSALGPAISVFRYDDNAFGQQLDEVLLLPPTAIELEQTSTGDFVWSADAWWVNLINPKNGSMGLYRFDQDWNFLDQVNAPFGRDTLELHHWAMKTLVNDGHSVAIQRFNAQGLAEVPLVSPLLKKLVGGQQRRATIIALSWRGGLLLCALATALGLCFGYLQRLRSLVYKSHRERGAQPVDDYEDTLQWIDPVANRKTLLRRRGLSYALLAMALVLLAMGNSVSALQLTALLIALSGPAIALLVWSRRPPGNIGCLDQNLLLVDHRGMYHMGEGSQLHYRGSFLILDDIVVFSGNRLLPVFSPQQIQQEVGPLAAGGVKVDSNTVWVKLLQSQHPLALGTIAIVTSATAAALLLGLQGVF